MGSEMSVLMQGMRTMKTIAVTVIEGYYSQAANDTVAPRFWQCES